MKATGIVRRLDDLGRIVIPKEIRRSMGVAEGDALEMFIDTETNGLTLVPYHSGISSKIKSIAENLSSMGYSEEEWAIANELKAIVKKLEKLGQ